MMGRWPGLVAGWLAITGLCGIVGGDDGVGPCSVLDYGAKGDGVTLDTAAVNAALADTSSRCLDNGVVFPAPHVFLCGSLHLRSHLEMIISPGAQVRGAANDVGAYDLPEPNPYDMYQDFGHSHWHNSLLWGVGLVNVTIRGGGTVDGGGMTSGQPPVGGGDKALALCSCSDVTVTNLTMVRTGHFAILATNVSYLTLTHLTMLPTRDGIDLVGVRHVWAQHLSISGGHDDAFVLKSDYSVGSVLEVYNVTCRDSSISTDDTTALEIGSETVGDIYNVLFANVTIHASGDAGIGIVTMDGSHVHDILYEDISMSNVTSPFQFTIGSRLLRPASSCHVDCEPGRIFNVLARNIAATDMFSPCHGGRNWTATIDGQNFDPLHGAARAYPVGPNITLSNISLRYRGGGLEQDVALDPAHPWNKWMNIGVRPAWGWYLRNVVGLVFDQVTLSFSRDDGRPAMMVQGATNVSLRRMKAERGTGVGYDVGVRPGCTGIVIQDSPGFEARSLPAATLGDETQP